MYSAKSHNQVLVLRPLIWASVVLESVVASASEFWNSIIEELIAVHPGQQRLEVSEDYHRSLYRSHGAGSVLSSSGNMYFSCAVGRPYPHRHLKS